MRIFDKDNLLSFIIGISIRIFREWKFSSLRQCHAKNKVTPAADANYLSWGCMHWWALNTKASFQHVSQQQQDTDSAWSVWVILMILWKGAVTKTRNRMVCFFRSFPFFPEAIFCHKLKNLSLGIFKIVLKSIHNKLESNRAFYSIPLWPGF